MTTDSLVEEWRPETLDEVQGHGKAKRQLKEWAEKFAPGDSPRLLHGPPGTGKTSTVNALANEMGWDIIEVNASDARTSDDIERISNRISSGSIQSDHRMVFVDEIDSLHHSVSTRPLSQALTEPQNPVIIVGNEEWSIPDGVKNKCKSYDFSLGKNSIKAKLREICEEEGIDLSAREIGKLATRGNLRSAIQDLQLYADDREIGWDNRDTELDRFKAVDNIRQGKKYVGNAFNPEELVIWLTENLDKHFDGLEAGLALDSLSRADLCLGMVEETGDYRWWRYVNKLGMMTADLRQTTPYDGWVRNVYPVYFKESGDSPEDQTPEAKLYRLVKGYEDSSFEFGGDYTYFRRVLLPLIRDEDDETLHEFASSLGLMSDDESELEALGVDPDEFDSWMGSRKESEEDEYDSGLSDW